MPSNINPISTPTTFASIDLVSTPLTPEASLDQAVAQLGQVQDKQRAFAKLQLGVQRKSAAAAEKTATRQLKLGLAAQIVGAVLGAVAQIGSAIGGKAGELLGKISSALNEAFQFVASRFSNKLGEEVQEHNGHASKANHAARLATSNAAEAREYEAQLHNYADTVERGHHGSVRAAIQE